MKTLSGVSGVVGILLVSSISTFAIEGLEVSVQATNAVLSWPSMTNETFLAQYRQTLNATDSWLTLTNDFPAATNATTTVFSNSVAATTGFYRVVPDGVQMYGITNGMVVSNELITPVEFAVDSTDQIVGVTFYDENTNPIVGATAQSLSGNAWLLVWNTTLSLNGDYIVYAELNFASDSPVVSQPVTVTVDNAISFPNYSAQVFGDQMWIYAQTVPDASFQLEMYDENTNDLGYFAGNADDDGTISFLWNLVDGNGIMHDDTNFLGVFTVDTSSLDILANIQTKTIKAGAAAFQTASLMTKTLSNKIKSNGIHPDAGGSFAGANQFWVKEGNWTPNNNWVVAYSPLVNPSGSNVPYYEWLMMLGGPDGNDGGVIGTLDGNDFHGTLSPGNVPQTSAFALADTNSRAQLLSYLSSGSPVYENFYYFGHGNDSAISAYNSAATGITADQVAFALGNVPLSYDGPDELINVDPPIMVTPKLSPQILHAALHPYRFVFLDGCETGDGNFCEAFGIPAQTLSTNNFAAQGVESRAFLGYKKSISFNTAQWDYRSMMLRDFFQAWESGAYTLQTCVAIAQAEVFQPMDSSAVIYGAYDMELNTSTRSH